MPLLVRTPSPRDTESLFGYVLRLSEYNGYNTPHHVFQVAEINRNLELKPSFPVEQVARVVGCNEDVILRISYRRQVGTSYTFKILGHELGNRARSEGVLRFRHPRFCPLCVKDSGYIDAFWDLSAAVTCPVHACKVLTHCGTCGKAIRWVRPGLLTCRCGAELTGDACAEADRTTVELMKYVQARLHQRRVTENPLGFPTEWLDAVPFGSLMLLLSVLGHHKCMNSGVVGTSEETAIPAAAASLADWPRGYHELLANLGDHRDVNSVAPQSRFKRFYNAMFKNSRFSAHVGFLREFSRFGSRYSGRGVLEERTEDSTEEGSFISKFEYMRRYGAGIDWLNRQIADGNVVTKVIRKDRHRVVIDLKLSKTPEKPSKLISGREAALHLGLPVSVIENLRTRRVIGTKSRRNRRAGWYTDDIDEFKSRCMELAGDRILSSDSEGIVELRSLMKLRLRDSATKADIVAAVLDGRLPIAGRCGENVGGLALMMEEVRHFIDESRIQARNYTCSFPDAAARTRLYPDAVRTAVEMSLLKAVKVDRRLRITAASIADFNRDYMAMGALAKRLRTRSGPLVEVCRKEGIPFITLPLPRADGREQLILPRSSETRLIGAWRTR